MIKFYRSQRLKFNASYLFSNKQIPILFIRILYNSEPTFNVAGTVFHWNDWNALVDLIILPQSILQDDMAKSYGTERDR